MREQFSAKELQGALLKDKRKYSLVAIYKELNKLQAQSIVVKAGKNYYLSFSWILEMTRFSEDIYLSYMQGDVTRKLIPAAGERRAWTFNDLQRMDRFWVQIMFTLYEASESRIMFEWVPHLWFPLVDLDRDRQYLRAMEKAGNKLFIIIGSDTYLDRLSTKDWRPGAYEWSYAKGPFDDERQVYMCVIDDYVMRVTLDDKTNSEIDKLFTRVKSKEDLNIQKFYHVFTTPCRATIKLTRQPAQAKKLRRSFCDFFGVAA